MYPCTGDAPDSKVIIIKRDLTVSNEFEWLFAINWYSRKFNVHFSVRNTIRVEVYLQWRKTSNNNLTIIHLLLFFCSIS